jgi:ABC-type Fe3+/spermidine/putrescine transport system ATPase subunit
MDQMMHTPPFIEVRDLVAGYGGKIAVKGLSLQVKPGSHLSLLGPSGCGKSTVLRNIAGLETPLEGEIIIDGQTVFSAARRINLPPEKRRLSMVFQSYAIWPHMTVMENVAYGLRMQKLRGLELRQRVVQALESVGMAEFIDRPATSLSGGQQQRVALARAYAFRPKAVLLDEPLSNLDARLRVRMRSELKDLQQRFGLTTIYVTHDQEEAMALSDRVIIMREGQIEQEGAPLEIYDRPQTRFVADFIGGANILTGTIAAEAPDQPTVVQIGRALLTCSVPRLSCMAGPQSIAVRPVYPQIARAEEAGRVNQWPAYVKRRALLGDLVIYTVEWPGGTLNIHSFPTDLFEEGEEVWLHIPPSRAVLLRNIATADVAGVPA